MKKIVLAMTVVLVIGCGIKGPPLPPIETVQDRSNNANLDLTTATSATKVVSGDSTIKAKQKSK